MYGFKNLPNLSIVSNEPDDLIQLFPMHLTERTRWNATYPAS